MTATSGREKEDWLTQPTTILSCALFAAALPLAVTQDGSAQSGTVPDSKDSLHLSVATLATEGWMEALPEKTED